LSRLFTTVRVLGTSRPSSGSSRGRNGRPAGPGTRRVPGCLEPRITDRKTEVIHIAKPPGANGLRYNAKVITSGAQTERRGDAGPVRGLLGGKDRTGRFFG